jgi:hypothetical protein
VKGRATRDFFVADGKYNLTKETKVGAAYYFLKDKREFDATSPDPAAVIVGYDAAGNPIYDLPPVTTEVTEDAKIHMVGVNGETVVGPVNLTGFLVGQFGEVTEKQDISAFAANVGASMKAGKGTLRAEFLYASGDEGDDPDETNAFYSVPYESGYYNGEMIILGRDKNALTIDNAIVYDTNNLNHGVIFAALGYDLPLSDKMSCSTNLGMAWNAEKQAGEDERYLGTEINAELNYKVSDNMYLGARAGYVFLGDYYDDFVNGSDKPDNPYDVKLIAKYSF